VPLLVMGALTLTSPKVRSTLLAIPMSLLIGVNALRVFGVLFLLLAAAGRLSGPFPFSAGFGDIITGALAVPLALSVVQSHGLPVGAIKRWNIFGALDLLFAIGFGITQPREVRRRRVGGNAASAVLPRTNRIGTVLPHDPRDHRNAAECSGSAFRPASRRCRCMSDRCSRPHMSCDRRIANAGVGAVRNPSARPCGWMTLAVQQRASPSLRGLR
jgi:hypothetical protein